MSPLADLKVAGLELAVTRAEIAGVWTAAGGARETFVVGGTADILPRIDALRAELRDPMRIAAGLTPRLSEFSAGWGRAFLPRGLDAQAPDVLVVIPHAVTHDLPLHLVRTEAGILGARIGVTYASSRALFIRNLQRNPARSRATGAGDPAAPPPARDVDAGGTDVLGDLQPEFEAVCRAVADAFAGRRVLFLGDEYNRMAAKAAMRRKPTPAVICAMAHGYVDPADHRMSGLLVETQAGVMKRVIPLHGGRYFDFRDMPLRRAPRELRAARPLEVLTAAELEIDGAIACELVMLLACSAGWGRVLQGDEPASLAETWLKIGAPSVVAPMWDAPVTAVKAWTAAFLEGWARLGLPKALAFRHAMLKMIDAGFGDAPERLGVMTLRGDWL